MYFLWPALYTSFLAINIVNQSSAASFGFPLEIQPDSLDYSLPKYIWISRAVLVVLLGGSTGSAMPQCLLQLFGSARGLPFLICDNIPISTLDAVSLRMIHPNS